MSSDNNSEAVVVLDQGIHVWTAHFNSVMAWFDFELPRSSVHRLAWTVAGLSTVLSTFLTICTVKNHLSAYRLPRRQRYIIRILWIVPVYAIDSFLSLVFSNMALIFHVPRDIYESYALYNFLALCIDYLGGNEAAQEYMKAQPPLQYAFPCKGCGDHSMNLFLDTCRINILQYAVVSPCTAVLTLALHWSGVFDEGSFRVNSSNFWITVINNTSATLALYYMVEFYRAARCNPSLKAARPLSKFLTIKAIIFLTFFQTFTINVLFALGFIDSSVDHDKASGSFSDFLICVEMAIISVIHRFVWPASEHRFGYYPVISIDDVERGVQVVAMDRTAATRDMVGISDLCQDIFITAKTVPALSKHTVHSAVDAIRSVRNRTSAAKRENDSRDSRWKIPGDRYRWTFSDQVTDAPADTLLEDANHSTSSNETTRKQYLENKLQDAKTPAERLDARARLAAFESLVSDSEVIQKQAATKREHDQRRAFLDNGIAVKRKELAECTYADERMELHAQIALYEHEGIMMEEDEREADNCPQSLPW